jgi:hypothetical protein
MPYDIPDNIEPGKLARAIIDVSEAMKKLSADGLNERAVLILLQHETKLPLKTLKVCLSGMQRLVELYVEN